MRYFTLGFLFITTSWYSGANENRCIDGSPRNQTFTRTLQTSNSYLIAEFRAKSAFKLSEGGLGCSTGNCGQKVHPMSLPAQVSEIPKECIKASLKRKVAQTSYECRRKPDGNWNYVKHTSRSKVTPCIDDTSVDYIHHVTNKVISCFQGLDMGNGVKESIDPKLLYSKINNESGFNFSYSYVGGTGIGQLTEPAIQEMNVNSSGRHGRGRYILDAILKSNQSACQGLKPVITNDLKFKYKTSLPRCEWTSLETGMARNLIYSLGYYSYVKHGIIGKELRSRSPVAYRDPEILNLLALMGYGPGGPSRALARMRSMPLNSASLSEIKRRLKTETYLAATMSKLKEVKKIAGDSCRLL